MAVTPAEAATGALLLLAFLICLMAGIGIAVMPGFYDKLHYLAPAAVLSTAAVVVAMLIEGGVSAAWLKALAVLLVMTGSNPIVTHAAALAKKVRDTRREQTETKRTGP